MAIDESPEVNLEDPDWRFPIIEWLVEWKLPSDQIEARRIARRAKAFAIIDGELYKRGAAGILIDAFPDIKVVSCCKRYMLVPAVTMPGREHLSEKLSDKVFIGPQWSPTQRTLCGAMRVANSMQDKLTSRRKHCRRSRSHGPS
jgi:hypothetical protein